MTPKISLRQKAYDYIKSRILLGEIEQGERIYATDLSEIFSISVTPVREALLLLSQENLVNTDKRNGFTVRRISIAELEEYFFFRELLENTSAALITKNISEADIHSIRKLVDSAEIAYCENDLYTFTSLHFEFHKKLWESTHSKIYVDLLSSMNHIFIQIISLGTKAPKGVETAIKGHKEIIEAATAKDSERLSDLMVNHVRSAKKFILPLSSYLS